MEQQLLGIFNSPWLYPTIIWVLFWKGTALWHASQRKSLPWFIALFIINTMGLLEIGYLIWLKTKGEKIFS
jgi:methionyl-tRNA synthetase